MTQGLAVRLKPEPLRSLAAGSITSSYVAVGSPFAQASRIFWVQNLTNAQVTFSLDGINDHFTLQTQAFVLLDVTSNKTFDTGFFISQGTVVYVKEVGTPTTGSVYVSTFYGTDGYN